MGNYAHRYKGGRSVKLPLREFGDVVEALKGPTVYSGLPEKRNAARINVSAKVNIYLFENNKVERCFSALTRDISLTGIGLLQTVALSSKQHVIIALTRPHVPLFVISSVAACRPLADGLMAVGLEFLEIASKEACDMLTTGDSKEVDRIRDSMFR